MANTVTGHCRCRAISYAAEGEPLHHAICHCGDCRHSAGAPMVGWIAFKHEQVAITGTPVTYNSSGTAMRQFCGTCGTGLFYVNEQFLPGIIDIQSATLDEPDNHPPGAHIQTAEAVAWEKDLAGLPRFERYPPG
ncbi:MAG TPA: GFA family protein [Sphingomonas sp.]|jgi:hypothetical protein|nr:GFA family protein [Sphingomonas sp.]